MTQTLTAPVSITQRFQKEFPNSAKCYRQGGELFPNGVTHDSRYLDPFPIYIDRANGCKKWDIDGHEIIDFWSGHGSLLLGHSHPAVVEAVQRQMTRGTHPGACHESELEWGELVRRLLPAAEKLRFVGSGTEATLMALRLARMFTGKPKLLKFAGHFHGWHDAVMPGADASLDEAGVPGIPNDFSRNTVIVPPNDIAALEKALANDAEIGCVIIEPTGGHFGIVPVRGSFLRDLRELTTRRGVLLIFDEVVTGFRVHPGGAQLLYGVRPDLTTLAKVLAGGLPGGCVAGRADILNQLEIRPGKPKMKHPGTFNANPLSASAGIATLKLVATGEPNRRANEAGLQLRTKLNHMIARRGFPWIAYGEYSRVCMVPNYHGPRSEKDDFIPHNNDWQQLTAPAPAKTVYQFRCAMLLNGLDFMGLRAITNAAHTPELIDQTVIATERALEMLV